MGTPVPSLTPLTAGITDPKNESPSAMLKTPCAVDIGLVVGVTKARVACGLTPYSAAIAGVLTISLPTYGPANPRSVSKISALVWPSIANTASPRPPSNSNPPATET